MLWITQISAQSGVQSNMDKFSEQDLKLLKDAGVALAVGPSSIGEMAAVLEDGTAVELMTVNLESTDGATQPRQYWFEVIQLARELGDVGCQKLLRSVDLGDRCVFVLPQSRTVDQHLEALAGTLGSVLEVIKQIGLVLVALTASGHSVLELGPQDISVTADGTAQIRFGTQIARHGPQVVEAGHSGSRRLGPVVQLRRLIDTLCTTGVLSEITLAPLYDIFDRVQSAPNGDQLTGDLVVEIDALLRQERTAQAFDLVRKTQLETDKPQRVGLKFKLLTVVGSLFLVLCGGLVLIPNFGLGSDSEGDPTQTLDVTPGVETRDEELIARATSLVTSRFDLLEQITRGGTDIATVAQVTVPNSPAHTQLVNLISTLESQGTKIKAPKVTVHSAVVMGHGKDTATVRLSYQLEQIQVQGDVETRPSPLQEEVELTLVDNNSGWRILSADVVPASDPGTSHAVDK